MTYYYSEVWKESLQTWVTRVTDTLNYEIFTIKMISLITIYTFEWLPQVAATDAHVITANK